MANDIREEIVEVPADLIRRASGLAIDMGGSVLKFAYCTKDDFDQVVSEDIKLGRLRLVSFPRSKIIEGLDYVHQRAFLQPNSGSSEQPLLHATGVGCAEHAKLISEKLNVRLKVATEFDSFIHAFNYLVAHTPRHALLEPFVVDALKEPIEFVTNQLEIMSMAQAMNSSQGIAFDMLEALRPKVTMATGRAAADAVESTVETPLSEAEPDMFPCVLVMCGSGIAFMQIQRDKSFKVLDGSNRGGKCFIGVGMLLTGCKSFDELIELASKGDSHKVDQYSNELFGPPKAAEGDESQDDGSFYSLAKKSKPSLVFCFGKAASGEGQFNREDIAAAWLQYILLDLIQSLHYACNFNGIKRVFFCGGFTSHPLVRRILTTEMARRNMFSTFFQTDQVERTVTFDFIKPGQHLGALGCLIKSLDKTEAK